VRTTSVDINGNPDNETELLLYKNNKKGDLGNIQQYTETKCTK
jgi:hypothetical protein